MNMFIKLFDLQNGKVIPTAHCYNIKWLKDIMDKYKKKNEYLKVYSYLFYMLYPDPKENPYFHVPEHEKEEMIYQDIDADFDPEDEIIIIAYKKYKELLETPIQRAYDGLVSVLDKLSHYMKTTNISVGRDGNLDALIKVVEKYDKIRDSYKKSYKDLVEEQQSKGRGNRELGYDI